MWYLDFIKSLTQGNCQFAVAGGFAVALHGAIRGTIDLDLVVTLTLRNLTSIEQILLSKGFVSRIPVSAKEMIQFRNEYITKRNLIAWSFVNPKNPAQVVDLLIIDDLAKKKVVKMKIAGQSVPVVSRASLIQMKRKAGRPQDLEDIKALEALNEKN